MEQSPSWETNISSASQGILRILWNPEVHYRTHNIPPPVLFLSEIDPVHTPSHFTKIHFNIILPSVPRSFKWSPFHRFPHQNSVSTSPFPPYVQHAPPILVFLIWSPKKKYLVRSVEHQAPRNVVFCTRLLGTNILSVYYIHYNALGAVGTCFRVPVVHLGLCVATL